MSSAGESLPWEVIHITSDFIAFFGFIGAIASIVSLALMLCDRDKKK